jgi:hypothetical protein
MKNYSWIDSMLQHLASDDECDENNAAQWLSEII